MQPENNPRALPLAVDLYGRDARLVGDPAMLDRELVVSDRAREGRGAQRAPSEGESAGSGALQYGELEIDLASRVVTYAAVPITGLRRQEYALLTHMAADPERVWTRHELLLEIWGYRTMSRTVDTHASRVRSKLTAAGAFGWVVCTWGVGYRLAP